MPLSSRATGPSRLLKVSRQDFLDNRWEYRPGEHVTFIGNTGSGKTYMAFQLLGGDSQRGPYRHCPCDEA